MMIYKKNYKEVIERLKGLYSGQGLDKVFAKMNITNPVIEKLKKERADGEVEYPDIEERVTFWDDYLSIYADLEDDSIPSAYMSEFDEGLYAALFGADIRFQFNTSWGWISSMVAPFIKDLDEVNNFALDEENIWFKRYVKQLKLFTEKAKNKFGISHFILINGLNFLMEIRGGTNAYYDVFDEPEKVRAILDFAVKMNIWVHNRFFEITGLFEGGTCSNLAQWIPGRIISESVDTFHLTSVDMFEEWGREPIQKVFDQYDGGLIHIHSNGHHLIERVSTLRNLKCIALLDEEFSPPVYRKLEQLDTKRGKVPFHISMPYEAFADRLVKRDLPANIFYNVLDVPDIKSANLLMKEVRNYRV